MSLFDFRRLIKVNDEKIASPDFCMSCFHYQAALRLDERKSGATL